MHSVASTWRIAIRTMLGVVGCPFLDPVMFHSMTVTRGMWDPGYF